MKSSVLAIGFSTLIHLTSPIHFLVAVIVLLLAWPATEILIEWIAARNPHATGRATVTRWWAPILTFGIVLAVAAGLRHWIPLPFMTAFAYALLVLSVAGVLTGALLEWAESPPTPGGSLNHCRRV